MDHQLVRVGRRQVLVVDVCASADGHGVGYGIILKRIERVVTFARAMRVAVFYSREARSINTAIFRLQSDEVEVLPRVGWRSIWLRGVWTIGAPFRLGAPGLWVERQLARTILGRFYGAMERNRVLPRRLRRFILRPRPFYQRLRRANGAYAELSTQAWKQTFKQHATPRLREAEEEGRTTAQRLSLPPDRERDAAAQAARFGLTPSDRIVTVHVRGAGYRSAAGLRQREWDALRNADVDTYLEAFDALVECGFRVVRLGDRTMPVVERTGVVDLATSPHNSQWLETWCVQHSEFLIGCDSGPSWLAFLLGVPVLTINAVHFRDVGRAMDRMICKVVRERATGRTLSVSEMLTEEYLRTGLDVERYEHIDNDPQDIREAVLDMIDVVAGTEQTTLAQRRFKQRLVELGKELPHEWTGLEGIAFHRQPRGTLSSRFAKKYFRRISKKYLVAHRPAAVDA